MIDYDIIETDDDLIEFRKHLYYDNINTIAMDFEADYSLRHFGKTLCLIQIFDGSKFYIIDPFQINREELIKFFQNRKLVKYMYAAGSDVGLIYDNYKTKVQSVYDLQFLVDVLQIKPQGLDKVIKNVLGVDLNYNKKKYQLFDWSERPLPEDAVDYALNDVKYLFKIHDTLKNIIVSKNVVDKLIEKLIKADYDFIARNEDPKLFRSPEFLGLDEKFKEIFRGLFCIRKEFAQENDIPENNLLANELLFEITKDFSKIDNIKFTKRITENIRVEFKNEIIEYAMHCT